MKTTHGKGEIEQKKSEKGREKQNRLLGIDYN